MPIKELDSLLPCFFSGFGVIVTSARVGKGVTDARINLDVVILAEFFQGPLKPMYALERYPRVLCGEVAEYRYVQGQQLACVVSDLTVVDDGSVEFIRK